jgi:hypothetical protein
MATTYGRRRTRGGRLERGGAWDRYWQRFRDQEIDEPVEHEAGGVRQRFEKQRVDDPVAERRARRRSS